MRPHDVAKLRSALLDHAVAYAASAPVASATSNGAGLHASVGRAAGRPAGGRNQGGSKSGSKNGSQGGGGGGPPPSVRLSGLVGTWAVEAPGEARTTCTVAADGSVSGGDGGTERDDH